ncbi:MAG: DUF3124 domain-containing protein [Flavobacteriales bacterium]|nr:DUF3124 domain-containing protein [Flavobacteriales bacterium]MCB9195458.1 DUF3124 domain-containing protein [Flavobacteriales bacterium]MCB9198362.1 DUF3124 domain-containing protein [Flavobacteriales bacterium]
MKTVLLILLSAFLLISCSDDKKNESITQLNWDNRSLEIGQIEISDSLYLSGQSYLSIYSHIYSQTEHITHDLTVTVSIRNPNINDSIFVKKANYYNTQGDLIRQYIDELIYVAPLETLEIVIDQSDNSGGSGANFIFDWTIKEDDIPPIFEAIMISTYGQQGLSFSTQGIRIK